MASRLAEVRPALVNRAPTPCQAFRGRGISFDRGWGGCEQNGRCRRGDDGWLEHLTAIDEARRQTSERHELTPIILFFPSSRSTQNPSREVGHQGRHGMSAGARRGEPCAPFVPFTYACASTSHRPPPSYAALYPITDIIVPFTIMTPDKTRLVPFG